MQVNGIKTEDDLWNWWKKEYKNDDRANPRAWRVAYKGIKTVSLKGSDRDDIHTLFGGDE